LKVIELSATAVGTSSRRTSETISACCAGAENALTTPRQSVSAITTHVVANPAHASTASPPASTIASVCVTSRSFRRSTRSARLPAHGVRTRIGMNCEKPRTPSSSAECVRR
jgi:hypothetical protein